MSIKKTFKINGIHCKSCKTLIEEEVGSLETVKKIEVNHLTGETFLEFDGDIDKINQVIEKIGYTIDKHNSQKKNVITKQRFFSNKFFIAGSLLSFFFLGLFLIHKFELFNLMGQLNESNISYGIIFAIGLLAGFHCIGMCGGLVVTYSASANKNKQLKSKATPHFQYNLGRLISYTAIGGVLGGFGSFFGVNPNFAGGVTLLAAIFMILMGASILTKHKWLDKIKLKTPNFIARFLFKNKHNAKPKGPLFIGLLTGFMPCGPLQAMQLFALTSGSAYSGAMAMFLYSLGTIPLMFGFGSFITLISGTNIKRIMKFSGALVILLGLFMFNRALINFGYGFSSLLPADTKSKTEYVVTGDVEEFQVVDMDVTYSGYKPNVMYLKKDVPVRWVIHDKGVTGCTNAIQLYLPEGTIKKDLNQKETIIEFTPKELGELKFSCWMRMVWGKFIVTDDGEKISTGLENEEIPAIVDNEGATCGANTGEGESCGCGSSRIREK